MVFCCFEAKTPKWKDATIASQSSHTGKDMLGLVPQVAYGLMSVCSN